jgi:hypothetical protein
MLRVLSRTHGAANKATGQYSSVSGGQSNNAAGQTSSVSGGDNNQATGTQSSVSGGLSNAASGFDQQRQRRVRDCPKHPKRLGGGRGVSYSVTFKETQAVES